MFTNISWGNYTTVVVLVLLSWYLFIGLRFYFVELKDILTGKQKFLFRSIGNKGNPEIPSNLDYQESPDIISSQSYVEESDQTFQEIEILLKKMRNVVADAAQGKLLKQEFMDEVGQVLKEYPSIKNSSFRSSISEVIVSECDKLESIHLTEEEAEALWDEKN
ncbi:hypothetical protein [Flavobacterium sp. XS2P39]|uniref:hypothetical protein n=1 Tax=Flavobacterium sp. XS2P39 TaxID=3401725 RepID=UPI003AAB8DF1